MCRTQTIEVITGARVHRLIKEGDRVVGVEYVKSKATGEIRGTAVVLTTGGFAADRGTGGLLEKYLFHCFFFLILLFILLVVLFYLNILYFFLFIFIFRYIVYF